MPGVEKKRKKVNVKKGKYKNKCRILKINATLLKGQANPKRRGEKKINPKSYNACYVYAADFTVLEKKIT